VSAIAIAGLGILLLFVLLALRMPISYAMGSVGLAGIILVSDFTAAMQLIASDTYRQFSTLTMAVIPLFIFMGQIVYQSGMSTKLFDAAYKWFGWMPGGLAVTTIATGAMFSAVSGSNSAGTATIGSIALPEMKKYKYKNSFAGGTNAMGGTLGIIIPPSTAIIIVAVQAEQSIVTLFRASLFPAFLLTVSLIAAAFIFAKLRPTEAPRGPRFGWGERIRSLSGVVEIVILFALSVVGMLLGWFSPTEAAGVGAVGAVVIGVVTRQLTWSKFRRATFEALRVSAFVILLVWSAVIFGRFLTFTRLPFELAEWASSLAVAPVVVLLILVAIYLVGGALMDALGFLVLSIPIFFPLLASLGYDLVWATILVILITSLGAVTPPVGVNAFITSGLDPEMSLIEVFKGTIPYYIPYVLILALIIIWPQLVLFAV
jgi:tripartite ATP-independent transporter DctM subunit